MLKYILSPLLFSILFIGGLAIGTGADPIWAAPVLQEKEKRPSPAVTKTTKITKVKSTAKKSIVKKSPAKKTNQNVNVASQRNVSKQRKVTTPPPRRKVASAKPRAVPVASEKGADSQNCQLEKKLSAKSVIVMNAATGETIYSLSPDTPRQPASTIKVLTGLIAIKSLDYNDTVPVSHKAAEQPSSKIYLDKEKNYKADDLINAVLLASANDASVALAEKIAGSESSFAQMMTMQAKLCGAQNTVCKTANGLTADGQSSSARDLANIFRHAMENDEFSKRMKQVRAQTAEGKLLRNHNKALWQIQGAEGGKTGFTNAAGQTYVGKFKRGSREIIVAIMGSGTMWGDLKTLVEYGFSQEGIAAEQSRQESKKVGQPTVLAGLAADKQQPETLAQ